MPLRPHDIPQSFYPGMWLRRFDELPPYTIPHMEVVRVGRTHAHVLQAGSCVPVKHSFDELRHDTRKVYESPKPKGYAFSWIQEGVEFEMWNFDTLRIRKIRWSYASMEVMHSGLLMFTTLVQVAAAGQPRRSLWARLTEG